jgi:hypothetical protein
MLALGIILIVLGLVLPALKVLFIIGLILAVIGGVALALSFAGRGPRLY